MNGFASFGPATSGTCSVATNDKHHFKVRRCARSKAGNPRSLAIISICKPSMPDLAGDGLPAAAAFWLAPRFGG
jgi:hypothetical protein